MIKNVVLADYADRLEELITVRPLVEFPVRCSAIENLNEDFYQATGQNLPAFMLSKLSDWLLMEILIDRDVDKVSNTEFAILSHRQLRRRDKRENSVDGGVMDYLNLKYVKNKDSLSKKVKKESE